MLSRIRSRERPGRCTRAGVPSPRLARLPRCKRCPSCSPLLAALALATALRTFLAENGHVRTNYRQVEIPCPLGLLIPAAALLALIPLALLYGLFDSDTLGVAGLFLVLGVAALGLADDAYAGASRGWRGHGAAALRGSFSTGAAQGRRDARPRAHLERAHAARGRRGSCSPPR